MRVIRYHFVLSYLFGCFLGFWCESQIKPCECSYSSSFMIVLMLALKYEGAFCCEISLAFISFSCFGSILAVTHFL